jgi:hypothetical protein
VSQSEGKIETGRAVYEKKVPRRIFGYKRENYVRASRNTLFTQRNNRPIG